MQSTHDAVERISSPNCEIGENPLWYRGMKKFFFVDIPAGTVLHTCSPTNRSQALDGVIKDLGSEHISQDE